MKEMSHKDVSDVYHAAKSVREFMQRECSSLGRDVMQRMHLLLDDICRAHERETELIVAKYRNQRALLAETDRRNVRLELALTPILSCETDKLNPREYYEERILESKHRYRNVKYRSKEENDWNCQTSHQEH